MGADHLADLVRRLRHLTESPTADRPGVIAALEAQSDHDARAVAKLMRAREPV